MESRCSFLHVATFTFWLLTLTIQHLVVTGRPYNLSKHDLPFHVSLDIPGNQTLLVRIVEAGQPAGNTSELGLNRPVYDKNTDHLGAVVYVCAVILMYGFSIVLMIGSLVKKSMSDQRVRRYMKALDKVRRYERRLETYKASMIVDRQAGRAGSSLHLAPSLCTVREDKEEGRSEQPGEETSLDSEAM